MMGVIQLSALVSVIARHSVSDTLGCLSYICITDRWWFFFFVTDNLDKVSSLLFSCLGMCFTVTLWNQTMVFRATW